MRRALTALTACLILACLAHARITKGPVLLRVSKDRAALVWETDSEGPGRVLCRGPESFESRTESAPVRVDYSEMTVDRFVLPRTGFIHKVWIEGLIPETRYTYRIIEGYAPSGEYGFRTAPAGEEAKVRFVVYGDSRTYPARHRRVVEQIIKAEPDFVVNVGDLVSSGNFYEQWGPELFEPIKGLAESVPYYSVKGNHDMGTLGFFERLLVPPGEENRFSFDYGPVHYYGLDNYGDEPARLLERLKDDFASRGGSWNFVTYHEPSLNIGGHASDWGFPIALPALSAARVDFVVTGHSHIYERFLPLAPPAGGEGSFVTCITSGGGGAPVYDVLPSPFLAGASSVLHFCLFEIQGATLDLTVIDDQGRIIDRLSLKKSGGSRDESYIVNSIPLERIAIHQHLYRTLAGTLQARPDAGRPVQLRYRFTPSPLGEGFKAVLTLLCDEERFKPLEAKTVDLTHSGAFHDVELTAHPRENAAEGGDPNPPMKMTILCQYESPSGEGEFRAPVWFAP